MGDQLAPVTAQRAPDVGAVGGRIEALGERRPQRRDQQLPGELRADQRPLRGVQEGRLDRLGPVQVGVQAAVEQMDGDELDGELMVAREGQVVEL